MTLETSTSSLLERAKNGAIAQAENTPVDKCTEILLLDESAADQGEPSLDQLKDAIDQEESAGAMPGLVELLSLSVKSLCKVVFGGLGLCLKTAIRYLLHHPSHAIMNVLLLVTIALLVLTGSRLHDQLILTRITERTVDSIIKASRYTRSYDSEEVGRAGVQSFLRVGAPEWAQRESIRAVLFHARRKGLSLEDQAVLLATVEVESGYNPMARAPTTSACGLFQFVRGTGALFGLRPADCMNPWRNAEAGIAHYISNYRKGVADKVGGLIGPGKLFSAFELSYFMHHDGPDASKPSPEVKTVVLDGTRFLFQVYQVLLEEQRLASKRPTFKDSFTECLWEFLSPVVGFTERATRAVLALEAPLPNPESEAEPVDTIS